MVYFNSSFKVCSRVYSFRSNRTTSALTRLHRLISFRIILLIIFLAPFLVAVASTDISNDYPVTVFMCPLNKIDRSQVPIDIYGHISHICSEFK